MECGLLSQQLLINARKSNIYRITAKAKTIEAQETKRANKWIEIRAQTIDDQPKKKKIPISDNEHNKPDEVEPCFIAIYRKQFRFVNMTEI